MPRPSRVAATAVASVAMAMVGATGFVQPAPANARSTEPLPLLTIDDFDYVGAFAVPADDFGESNMNYAEGPLEFHDGSVFMVGHSHENAIAEFVVPVLVDSTDIDDLNTAADPTQPFATVLDRPAGGNDQNTNRIGGLEHHDGQLIVNAYEYYDAAATNTDTTLVVRNADGIESSHVDGYFSLDGHARASGWMTQIPAGWQASLGGTHMVGHSSGIPIIGRASVGPSAYALDADDVLATSSAAAELETTTLLEFSLDDRLAEDLSNDSGTNELWTHQSRARFGFIVPGTRTYVTLGESGGHESGIGYKITQDDGNLCGGYCSFEAADNENYYWMWDLDDLLAVKAGDLAPHAVRPYAAGPWDVPFQTDGFNPIGGGTFDMATGTLYLTVLDANDQVGTYSNPPIVVAYQFPTIPGSSEAAGEDGSVDFVKRLHRITLGRDSERVGDHSPPYRTT